jgi:peptidoglycan/xylan/chitin deacetylase (PgdA/CDA1 family)
MLRVICYTGFIGTVHRFVHEKGNHMADNRHNQRKKMTLSKKIFLIVFIEILVIAFIFGGYRLYIFVQDKMDEITAEDNGTAGTEDGSGDSQGMTQEQIEAKAEQERLFQEEKDRKVLIAQADQLAFGYNYDGAIELLKSYQGTEGGYQVYTSLVNAIDRLESERSELSLYGGVYHSVYEISHLFFNPLIADTARAFDNDSNSSGYNKYNITVSEFTKLLQSLYDQGYVLVNVTDVYQLETQEDGSTKYVPNKFYLNEGKKPIILSEDDVAYYEYMLDDGFASRIVLDGNGKPTCEMIMSDGTTSTGAFDIVPIVDAFVEQHPDFSYNGAKGLLTLTGYEGVFGYRTNDSDSATYAEDVGAAKKVAEALKAEGWEFACHSWGHRDMQAADLELLMSDTNRWLSEVGSIVGPTEIYAFPFGNDIEAGGGLYSGDKYEFLKASGFNVFLGVYKEPWLHIKRNYVRMTRRPIDGEAFLLYPDRLKDLFNAADIVYPSRPNLQ